MGRRRRRKKVIRRVIRRLPSIFECPSCGAQAIRIEMKKEEGIATIQCGSCGLTDTIRITPLSEPVDVYGEFIDKYYATIENE
jgi:transcription elongation factor Elf1